MVIDYATQIIILPFVGSKKGNSGSKEANFGYVFGEDSYQDGTKVEQYYKNGITTWNWFFSFAGAFSQPAGVY